MESDIYGNTALPLAPDLQKPSNPTDLPIHKLASNNQIGTFCTLRPTSENYRQHALPRSYKENFQARLIDEESLKNRMK